MQGEYTFGGMSSILGQRGVSHGLPKLLPKLDTNGFNTMEYGGGRRTAPPIGGFGQEVDFEGVLFSGSTINPNALHYHDSSSMAMDSMSPYHQAFGDMSASQTLEENFD